MEKTRHETIYKEEGDCHFSVEFSCWFTIANTWALYMHICVCLFSIVIQIIFPLRCFLFNSVCAYTLSVLKWNKNKTKIIISFNAVIMAKCKFNLNVQNTRYRSAHAYWIILGNFSTNSEFQRAKQLSDQR